MTPLLKDIFNYDFTAARDSATFHAQFFTRNLTLSDLKKVSDTVRASHVTLDGKDIPAAMLVRGKKGGIPFAILAQLHGNEPAGLAGILLALALAEANMLEHDIIAVIGNPLAARQYFDAWQANPHARQETRDAYRCGLSDTGTLLPDMNRIPVDFLDRPPTDHHTRRAHELHTIGKHIRGILDIHSARGNMVCITDHKRDSDLRNSPIRSVLTELAEAISAHASATVAVQTLKTTFGTLFHLDSQTGIEAGRHEAPDAPYTAASFTLSLLHTLGITTVAPIYEKEDGIFERYSVRPRITYADLEHTNTLRPHDQIFMATACHALASVPARSDSVIVRQSGDVYAVQSITGFARKPAGSMEYAIYQYDEMEAVEKGQVVAVAVPSGTEFRAPYAFSGIFVSKAAAVYDKDPSVGPWPVSPDTIGKVKFCYPCDVSKMKVDF